MHVPHNASLVAAANLVYCEIFNKRDDRQDVCILSNRKEIRGTSTYQVADGNGRINSYNLICLIIELETYKGKELGDVHGINAKQQQI